MKRDLAKIFIDQIYSKPPMENYPTNEMLYNHIDEIWIIGLADMINYKNSNNRGYRYIFVFTYKFSKHLSCILLKTENSQTITQDFSKFLTKSKRSTLKFESNRGSEWYNSIFQNFMKLKKYTELLPIHRERFFSSRKGY